MSQATVRGKVHVVEETKFYGQKGFRKRLVVLEQDNGRFVNHIPIEFVGDACDVVDGLTTGDEVEVTYRLSGRKWQRDPQSEVKYFLTAEGMSYKKLGEEAASPIGSEPSIDDSYFDDSEGVPF